MRFTAGNRITLLETGDQYFPALLAAIGAAQREVHLETYIFDEDATGLTVAAALAQAAARGVTTRLLLDGIGCKRLTAAFSAKLRASGIEVLIYRPPPRRFSLHTSHLRRMHRKLVVIDGERAFCGGINIIDDRGAHHDGPPRYDFAVYVEGPLVGDMHRAARRLWLWVGWLAARAPAYPRMARRAPPAPLPGGSLAALLTRDNLRHRRRIEDAYIAAIDASEHEIFLACAYFLPGQRMRRALLAAAARGVRVRLLLQGRPDHALIHRATHALYRVFLASGIEIWEYTAAHLHAKVAVIDSEWLTVGSSNIDPFSLWLSREANVVIRDRSIAATLHSSLQQALHRHARRITEELAAPLPPAQRITTWLAYQLARLLIALAGYATRDEI